MIASDLGAQPEQIVDKKQGAAYPRGEATRLTARGAGRGASRREHPETSALDCGRRRRRHRPWRRSAVCALRVSDQAAGWGRSFGTSLELRRQRDLRLMPQQRSNAMARLATRARHGACHQGERARRLQRCELRLFRRAFALLPRRRQVHGGDRRPRRQDRAVRGEIHLRALSLAAISRRVSRRAHPGAVACLGLAPQERRRPALVSSLSQRGHQARRRAALDQAQSELELHVRRMPLDRRTQELRRRQGSLRHRLGRDQRRLRSVPRTGLGACGLGEGAEKLVALQGQRP